MEKKNIKRLEWMKNRRGVAIRTVKAQQAAHNVSRAAKVTLPKLSFMEEKDAAKED